MWPAARLGTAVPGLESSDSFFTSLAAAPRTMADPAPVDATEATASAPAADDSATAGAGAGDAAVPAVTESKASDAPDYTGDYVINKSKSDDFEPFLKAVGAPWIARKAAGAFTPTTTIRYPSAGKLSVTNASTFRTTTLEFDIGGGFVEVDRMGGAKGRAKAELLDDGSLLITNLAETDDGLATTNRWHFSKIDLDIVLSELKLFESTAKLEAGEPKVVCNRHWDRVKTSS